MNASGAAPHSDGLVIDVATYKANLQQVQDQVLPAGWLLNPVAKWDAYGHGIRNLASVAAQLGMPISVLTNQEAAEAIAAARAAGMPKPVCGALCRLMARLALQRSWLQQSST